MAVFAGMLQGRGGRSICRVKLEANGHPHVHECMSSLPDGNYDLHANGLSFAVRLVNGDCLPRHDDRLRPAETRSP